MAQKKGRNWVPSFTLFFNCAKFTITSAVCLRISNTFSNKNLEIYCGIYNTSILKDLKIQTKKQNVFWMTKTCHVIDNTTVKCWNELQRPQTFLIVVSPPFHTIVHAAFVFLSQWKWDGHHEMRNYEFIWHDVNMLFWSW